MYLRWRIPESLLVSPEVEYRNSLFRHLAQLPAEEVAMHCTHMSIAQMEHFVEIALREAGVELKGVGLEGGAGSGFLSAICARRPEVERIYAVEACEESARHLMPRVAEYCLGPHAEKVVPVFGTFDDLDLPDESLDFIVEFHSYHHSHDLFQTLSEAARVLKPGGILLGFDRCQPDSLSDEEVEQMLSLTYSREFLRSNFYPEDTRLTRGDNGEHEYRMHEWQAAFALAGMNVTRYLEFQEFVGIKTAVAGLVNAILPNRISPRRIRRRSFQDTVSWLRQNVVRSEIAAPRASSFFVLEKPAIRKPVRTRRTVLASRPLTPELALAGDRARPDGHGVR